MESSFLFVVCQLGTERALKRDMARLHPELRPAFQRPGLVTFKSDTPRRDDVVVSCALARAYGLSLGQAKDEAELVATLRACGDAEPFHLHVFPRDTVVPGEYDETLRAPGLEAAAALRDRLAETLGARVAEGDPAQGRLVLDVVCAEGEPWLVGAHRHHRGHSRHAGGRLDQVLPAGAPSRAYLKAVEGFDFADEPLEPGRVACEIGSSPGGAVFAMLERGLEVVGIDPGAMSETLLPSGERRRGAFHHLAMPVGAVTDAHLPARLDYLLLDVNLAPQVAFRSAMRLAAMRKSTLRALILTLKMNDYAYLENLAGFEARVRELGFDDVRARQLASNRREVCFVAKRSTK